MLTVIALACGVTLLCAIDRHRAVLRAFAEVVDTVADAAGVRR
jgi:hypothetical protein